MAGEIEHNVGLVGREGAVLGLEGVSLQQYTDEYKGTLNADSLEMMEGISLGSKLPFESILTYNAMQDFLYTDDCTLCAAVQNQPGHGQPLLGVAKRGREHHDSNG